jgi:hypothetical protein
MNIGIFFIEKRKDRECSKRNLFWLCCRFML